jgi:hypothetical protein
MMKPLNVNIADPTLRDKKKRNEFAASLRTQKAEFKLFFLLKRKSAIRRQCKEKGWELLNIQKDGPAVTSTNTRKCYHCNMEIPKGGSVCPFCKKNPGISGAVLSLSGSSFWVGLIAVSIILFPQFWTSILATIMSSFK